MMARSDEDARAILREHGHEPPGRGRLAPHWRSLAEDIAGGAEPGSSPPPDGAPGDYDAGVSEADFPPDEEEEAGPSSPATALPPERKPRRVRSARPTLRDRITGKAPAGKGKGRTRHARVATDRLIGSIWASLGKMAMPLSPAAGRTFMLQAPVAGLILDDTVKGTILDKGLQPLARGYDKGKKVFALAGPPVLVLAIEQAQGLPEPQRSMRLAMLHTMLEEALLTWVDVAGDKVETARARYEENAAAHEEVRRLMGLIFATAEVAEPEPAMAGAG